MTAEMPTYEQLMVGRRKGPPPTSQQALKAMNPGDVICAAGITSATTIEGARQSISQTARRAGLHSAQFKVRVHEGTFYIIRIRIEENADA